MTTVVITGVFVVIPHQVRFAELERALGSRSGGTTCSILQVVRDGNRHFVVVRARWWGCM
jgi:hypothetical protein